MRPWLDILGRLTDRALYPLGLHRLINRLRSGGAPNAVFIWIPKAAGFSIWNVLAKHRCVKFKDPYAVKHCFSQIGTVTFGHQSYSALRAAGSVHDAFDRTAFKFAFVRNPFARAVSLFFYLKDASLLHRSVSFRTFVYLLYDRAFEKVGLYNVEGLSQCNPQVDWVTDSSGRMFVDFIGRIETIVEDFRTVAEVLGFSDSLPHLNRTVHEPYWTYYDDETRSLVAEIYADDLRAFGYAFRAESGSDPAPLKSVGPSGRIGSTSFSRAICDIPPGH